MALNLFSRRVSSPSPEDEPEEQHLLLGWSDGSRRESFGFAPGEAAPRGHSQPVIYDGDSHLMTCAPTGTGKGRGVLIPNLLRYPGPAIVLDIKGELFQVTSRRRSEMGQ